MLVAHRKPIPYKGNCRKIPQRAVDTVATSIKEYDWRQAIVVDKDGVIIAGHTGCSPRRSSGSNRSRCMSLRI
jgi:hypothetical protein